MRLHICIYTHNHNHTHRRTEREGGTRCHILRHMYKHFKTVRHTHTSIRTYAPSTVTLYNARDDTNLSGRDAQTSAHRSDGGVGRCDVGESAEIKINHCNMVQEKVDR